MSVVRFIPNPTKHVYRTFGVSLILTGVGIGALLHFKYGASSAALILVVVLGILGAVPSLLPATGPAYFVYNLVSRPALFIGNIISVLIVSLFFFTIITPIGLILRRFRDDLFRGESEDDSYWVAVKGDRSKESYERQF